MADLEVARGITTASAVELARVAHPEVTGRWRLSVGRRVLRQRDRVLSDALLVAPTVWLTPPELTGPIEELLEGVDLDPMGDELQFLRADRIVLLPEDGYEVMRGARAIRIFYNGEFDDAPRGLAACSDATSRGCRTAALVPAVPGSLYWRRHVWSGRALVNFLGRVPFVRRGETRPSTQARASHALVLYPEPELPLEDLLERASRIIRGGVWLTSAGGSSRTPPVPPRRATTTQGERLKAGRTWAELNVREVAEEIGVDPSTISRWENAERQPRFTEEIARKLAGLFRCEVSWLITGEGLPPGKA